MAIPTDSKTQEKTEEEQQYESTDNYISPDVEDSSQPPDKLPSQQITLPIFNKYKNQLINRLLKIKILDKEELMISNRKHEVDNITQVIYSKVENEKQKVPRDIIDRYYLYYIKGLEICQKHTDSMMVLLGSY